MSEAATTVALLFDDGELGAQLRDALHDRGARIVHEGGVAGLDRDLLNRLDADVLVINLDGAAEDALEGLYDMLEGDRPRVVFNDAQASRGLSGWDRARWARHLAAKVLLSDEVDPPRPAGARGLQPAAALEDAVEGDESMSVVPAMSVSAIVPDSAEDELDVATLDPAQSEAEVTTESLAAELEALLASDELPLEVEETSAGLRYAESDELPPLHDGNFGEAPENVPAATEFELARPSDSAEVMASAPAVESRIFRLDHLQLSPLVDNGEYPTALQTSVEAELTPSVARLQAPVEWALLDDEPLAQSSVELGVDHGKSGEPDSADFGIQKMSAADFLAPDVLSASISEDAVMSLELVSMEEAVAPQPYDGASHEFSLDIDAVALRRLVLVGATADAGKSLSAFFGAVAADTSLTFLVIQHADEPSSTACVQGLLEHSAIPVRLAQHQGRAAVGEVLVIPPGFTVKVARDGRIELNPALDDARKSPSIDHAFTMAANVFGRDALGIVMGGRSTDAMAGAQAIHDRGGQIWVEADDDYVTDMARALFAERLVGFSGDAPALAAHLVEVFS